MVTMPATTTSDIPASETVDVKVPERPKTVEWTIASVEEVRKLGGGTHELWCTWDGAPSSFPAGYNPGRHAFFVDLVAGLQNALNKALSSASTGEELHRSFNFPGACGVLVRATLKDAGAVYHFSPLARR